MKKSAKRSLAETVKGMNKKNGKKASRRFGIPVVTSESDTFEQNLLGSFGGNVSINVKPRFQRKMNVRLISNNSMEDLEVAINNKIEEIDGTIIDVNVTSIERNNYVGIIKYYPNEKPEGVEKDEPVGQ